MLTRFLPIHNLALCFCLKTPYLVYIVDLLTWSSQPMVLHLVSGCCPPGTWASPKFPLISVLGHNMALQPGLGAVSRSPAGSTKVQKKNLALSRPKRMLVHIRNNTECLLCPRTGGSYQVTPVLSSVSPNSREGPTHIDLVSYMRFREQADLRYSHCE